MRTQEEIGDAVIARLAHQFSVEVDPATVDRDGSLFADGTFALGGYELHSLELVEAMSTLEEDLRIPLLEEDLEQLDSVGKLAGLIARHGDPELVARFCDRWTAVRS